jgi:putative oxidoreductase
MLKFQEKASSQGWPNLLLRLMLGFGFASHGWSKLSRGPAAFGEILFHIGIPFPHLTAWVTAFVELLGGLSLIVGLLVIPISIPLGIVVLTAMFTVHLQYGFLTIKLQAVTPAGAHFGPPGYEISLLYIIGLLVLVLGGSGRYSLDNLLLSKFKSRQSTASSSP